MRISLHDITEVILAEVLLALTSETGKFSTFTLKSIRWGWKQLQLSCFQFCMAPLISSFTKQIVIRDRKESLVYPLLVLVQWERRILTSQASITEILVLGTFLLMSFSGMRFGDIQRMMLHRWQYDSSTLRGLAWRTKTCTSGVPWGIQCSGFLSKSSFHWVHKFLITLDAVYRHSDPSQIDFLLPSVDENGPRAPLTPMTYPEALYFVRRFIELPWRSSKLVFPDVTHYTVHGLKSTLISWASQLGISPELRRLQGKHKDPLQSTRLCSRDDVAGSLSLQSEILQRAQAGWRPQTSLQRGGQLPLVEPGFTLESFHKEAPSHAWQFFNFQPELCPVAFELEADSVDLSSDDSSSSEFSGASSNSVAKVPTKKQKSRPSITADEATVGIYRNMWHIVAQQSSSTSDTQPDAAPIITACGRKFSSVQFSITDFLELKSGQSVCMHPGC